MSKEQTLLDKFRLQDHHEGRLKKERQDDVGHHDC
jgi:hypothetical protein